MCERGKTRPAGFKCFGEALTGPKNTGAESARADIQRSRRLLIGKLAPDDKQERIALFYRKATEGVGEFGRHRRVEMLDDLRCLSNELRDYLQSSLLEATVIRDHVIGDPQKPRQSISIVAAAASPTAKRSYERLRREILGCRDPDPSRHIADHPVPVTFVDLSEQGRLLHRPRDQLDVFNLLDHALYVVILARNFAISCQRSRLPLARTLGSEVLDFLDIGTACRFARTGGPLARLRLLTALTARRVFQARVRAPRRQPLLWGERPNDRGH